MADEGYQTSFLGEAFAVELPTITAQYAGNVVRSETLRDGHILDYLNYSVVMNSETRQAFYSAANVDFNRNTGEGRNFRLDGRIDESVQLGDIYYKDIGDVANPYDRGHLTRRRQPTPAAAR